MLAESIGFDSVWVIDSQLLCREVTIALAAILASTTYLRAATGVTQPITRHASVMASAMATLDEMSGARAIMGIGTGFSSLRTIGLPQAKIAEVEAYIRTVRALLRGEGIDFNGAEARLGWIEQPPNVPIVVAATGPRMTRFAARTADGVILHQGLSPELLGRGLGWVREAERVVEVSCWAPYSLGATPAEARDRVRARVAGALMNARADWFDGAERDAVVRLQASYDVGHHASAAPDHAGIVPDSLVDRYALAGTATELREQFTRLLDQPGVDRVILTPQVAGDGAKPLAVVLRELDSDILSQLR
jgi:5,10-methylenetetrahydromethanopterin reductase